MHPDEGVEDGVIETSEVYMDIECETETQSGNLKTLNSNLSVNAEKSNEIVNVVSETQEQVFNIDGTIQQVENAATVQSNEFETEVFQSKECESENDLSACMPSNPIEILADIDDNVVTEECETTEEVVTDSLCENKEADRDPLAQGASAASAVSEYEAVEQELCEDVHVSTLEECLERIKGYLVVINSLSEHCGDVKLLHDVEGDLKRVLDRFPVMEIIGQ